MRAPGKAAPIVTILFLLQISAIGNLSATAAEFDHGHRLFSGELKKYVRTDGVRYKDWKEHRGKFDLYLEALKAVNPEDYEHFSPDERKAFWLNTYNALAIKLVLDNYPIKGNNRDYPANSMRQIPDCWKAVKWKAAGRDVDLYTIKHQILRSEIADYRTHFAVVPASRGGPKLSTRAYTPKGLDARLTADTTEFMNNEEHLQFLPDQQTIKVSKIFRWFALDFVKRVDGKAVFPPPADEEIVQEFVMPFAAPEVQKQFEGKRAKVEFILYDWSLNESL